MEALEALVARHATRWFQARPVPRAVLEKIVDAGRLAATARNEQPWEFIVVTDPTRRRALADLTDFGKFIAEAGACVVVICRATTYYLEDGAAAAQNMLVAAAALGVQSCWVSGDKRPYAAAVLATVGAPADHKLVALLPMGYEAQAVPRAPKRALESVLHWEQF